MEGQGIGGLAGSSQLPWTLESTSSQVVWLLCDLGTSLSMEWMLCPRVWIQDRQVPAQRTVI